ncbi:MAG: domain, FtsQ-type [Pseudomonadota bacterium]|jgi:hypothetical protein
MRKLLVVLAVFNLAVWGYGYYSGDLKPFVRAMGGAVERLRFSKDVRFAGLEILDRGDLSARTPLERSNLWWEFNRAGVAAALQEHPLIKSAVVTRCGTMTWGCFEVAITERQPEFVTEFGGKVWLVGADGAFMGRAPRAALEGEETPRAGFNPVILKGVDFDHSSPDTIKARLDLIRTTIDIVESVVGHRVLSATLVGGSDVALRLEGRPYTITFGLPDGDTARLTDEVARYVRLAAELGEKHRLVRSIDLAFDRVAVVKFIE